MRLQQDASYFDVHVVNADGSGGMRLTQTQATTIAERRSGVTG